MKKEEMGKILCCDCEKPVAYFPVKSTPTEDLELYCENCVDKEGNK